VTVPLAYREATLAGAVCDAVARRPSARLHLLRLVVKPLAGSPTPGHPHVCARQYVKLLTGVGPFEAGMVGLVIWMDSARDECVVRFADGRELTINCGALETVDEDPSARILAV
jgi:hypothetical protein